MIFVCGQCKKKFDDTDFEDIPDCDNIRQEGKCMKCDGYEQENEWEGLREESKAKKARNLEQSIKILTHQEIPFIRLSQWHLRIEIFDFWPTTGKYMNRKTKAQGRGVFNLIKEYKKAYASPKSI